MVRLSASILKFYFDSKEKNLSNEEMINVLKKNFSNREDSFQILHLDIMDGKFVKNKSFEVSQLRNIKKITNKKIEAHLMVLNYKKYLKDYFNIADMFIMHNEVLEKDFEKTINYIHKNKKFVGIAINPNTKLEDLKYLDKIDLVLIMSVYPGLPGQDFISTSVFKIKRLFEIRKKKKLKFAIAVDGGINHKTGKKCINSGADILVTGSWLFSKEFENFNN